VSLARGLPVCPTLESGGWLGALSCIAKGCLVLVASHQTGSLVGFGLLEASMTTTLAPSHTPLCTNHGLQVIAKWQKKVGKYLATAGNNNTVFIWDRTGQCYDQIDIPGKCVGLDWSCDGALLGVIQVGDSTHTRTHTHLFWPLPTLATLPPRMLHCISLLSTIPCRCEGARHCNELLCVVSSHSL
jgi:WD40 repeat protein